MMVEELLNRPKLKFSDNAWRDHKKLSKYLNEVANSINEMNYGLKKLMENFKHGMGVFTFEDGTTYEGPFEKDRMVNRIVKNTTNIEMPLAEKAIQTANQTGSMNARMA
jgi:hypothetical protein